MYAAKLALPNWKLNQDRVNAMTILRTLTLVVLLALYADIRAEPPEARTVRIPAGTFQMGGVGGSDDELPIHAVTISAYDLDVYEVTVADFRSFRADYKPSEYSACEQCPATNVSWEEADVYCRSIGKRLPTEAEYERACRGPEGWDFPWGNRADTTRARYGLDWHSGAVPVGSYPPNPWGVYDLGGNVKEWVSDYYSRTYYRDSPVANPQGPQSGRFRIARGGVWNGSDIDTRCADRGGAGTNQRGGYTLGFRCARSVDE